MGAAERVSLGSDGRSPEQDGVEQDLARLRAVFDAAPDGMAETDGRGVVRAANARLAILLHVPASFLVGKPLIHFVVRGDCAAFRAALEGLDGHASPEPLILGLRARHGGAPFAAEARARVLATGRSGAIVWAIRPWFELPAVVSGGPASLAGMLRSCFESTRRAARARRITLAEGTLADAVVAPDRVAAARDAIAHLARTALHLAGEEDTIRLDARLLEDGAALVTFGDASARVRLTRR